MRTVESADGTPIALDQAGAGPHLVLLHGATANRARWAPIRPRLEAHFTVTAVDRRGHGDSGDHADYALEREVEDVAAVIDALAGPAILFGHSFGAICALEAAMRDDRIVGLVLYEPPIFEGEAVSAEHLAQLDALLAADDREGLIETFLTEVVKVPPHVLPALKSSPAWAGRVASAHTLPRELRAAEAYPMAGDRLAGLSTPVLLLLGGASPQLIVAVNEALERALPNVRTVVMPGQSHIAVDTGPELVTDAVLDFRLSVG